MKNANYELIFTDIFGEKTSVQFFQFFRPAVRALLDRTRHGEVKGIYKIICLDTMSGFQDELTIYSDGTGSLLREHKEAYDILDSKIVKGFIRNALNDNAKETSHHIIKLRSILTDIEERNKDLEAIEETYNNLID